MVDKRTDNEFDEDDATILRDDATQSAKLSVSVISESDWVIASLAYSPAL